MAATLPRPPVLRLPSIETARRHVVPSRLPLTEHGARLAIVLAVACVAIFLDASTSYESSTALPYIQGAIGATPDQGSWVVTLFNAAYETATLLSPWFLARLGRRTYFVASLLVFAACSFGCALSSDYDVFLVLRLLQGFALGGFFACGVLSLFMSIPNGLQLIGVMLFSMSSQLGSALGPAVSGYLVYDVAWQWVFVLAAIPAVVLAIAIGFVLRDPVVPERVPFDYVGAALIAGTFLCLQYVVNEGERRNWSDDPWVITAIVASLLGGAATLVWKLRYSPHPFLDFRVLRHRNLILGALFGFGFGILLQASTLIGGFVERTLDFTPTLAGGLDALRAFAIVVFVPLVTFALAESIIGVRTTLLIGLFATFIGFHLEVTATTAGSDFTSFVVSFGAIGIGIAILYRALASVIFGTLPREDLIMNLLVYKLSGVIGSAAAGPIFATFLDRRIAVLQQTLAGGVNLASPAVRSFVGSGGGNAAALAKMVQNQAVTIAYSDMWAIASILALALVPAVFLIDLRKAAT
jgi:DHA2 family multidrug resistance protein